MYFGLCLPGAKPLFQSDGRCTMVIINDLFQYFDSNMISDTIYACQDYEDDLRIGIGSSAVTMRTILHPFLCICATVFVILMEVALLVNKHSLAFCVAAGVLMTGEMVSQLVAINPLNGKTCKGKSTMIIAP